MLKLRYLHLYLSAFGCLLFIVGCGGTADPTPALPTSTIGLQQPATPTRLPASTPTVLPTATTAATPTVERLGSSNFTCRLVSSIPESECEALVGLYFTTMGDKWGNIYPAAAERWLTTVDPCGWYGISCNDGHVVLLDLHESQLRGTLTSDIVGLSELDTLILYKNELGGPLPSELVQLSKLRSADFSNNQLIGSIPSSYGGLFKLEALNLNYNRLSGALPASLGELPLLGWLDLSYNRALSGSIPSSYDKIGALDTTGTQLADNTVAAIANEPTSIPAATATLAPPPPATPTVSEPDPTSTSSAPTTTNTQSPQPTATNTPRPLPSPSNTPAATADLAIVSFAVEVAYLPNGDENVTFQWETTGADKVLIWTGYSAFTGGISAEVSASGSQTILSSDSTLRWADAGIIISQGEQELEQTERLRFQCELDYFFEDSDALDPGVCPASEPFAYAGGYQPFERGFMLFFRDGYPGYAYATDRSHIAVFIAGQSFSIHEDTWGVSEQVYDPLIIPPDGMYQPQYGFGKVWREDSQIREGLGWAIELEIDYNGMMQNEDLPTFFANGTAYVTLPDNSLLLRMYTQRRNNTGGRWDILSR